MSPSNTEVQAISNAKTQAHKKIAVLGCGKMGTILLESFLERKLVTPQEAVATVQHGDRSQELSRELSGVAVGTDNRAAVAGADIVLLCVKPQVLGQLLEEIAPALAPTTLVISILLPRRRVLFSKSWARMFL
jgi:pyrroline-5-carboxylate reductase